MVEPDARDAHVDLRRRGGLDVEAAQRRGHLEDPFICTYDGSVFDDGHMIIGMLRTYPVALVGGAPAENPFFAPPEEFLARLKSGPRGH